MLKKAFPADSYRWTILHRDQWWQYQHQSYHDFLASKGIRPSMSRKENSPDNRIIESFFGILKSEMFYGYEKTLKLTSWNKPLQIIFFIKTINVSRQN